MSDAQITLAPASHKQELFLNSSSDITLAGGAAGSGKTYTSLLIALKFMMMSPKGTGVIFRRTSPMLKAPGSIWHEAVAMYTSIFKKGLRIRTRDMEIIFPNGSLLKFSHMQHASNMYDHKGAQYSLCILDEATDFTEEMVVYMLSRMRNANVNYKPQMFLMTNPDYDSFLRLWIQDFYLDPMTGIPREELAGVKRYFFRSGNTTIWYNSLEEAEMQHPGGTASGIMSFCFIPARIFDNPPLLKSQPSYLSNLMSLPRVEQARLLHGSWTARSESAGNWKREWAGLVDTPTILPAKRVRAWDFAFTKPSELYPEPDYTRGVLLSKNEIKVYTVEDVVSMRDRVHEVEQLVFSTAHRDGTDVVISIPVDPNAQAAAYAKDLQRRLAEKGFNVKLSKPVKSKLVRFAPFASVTQAGFVNVVKGTWNEEYFNELEIFNGDDKTKDDQCDATADAFSILNRAIDLPVMIAPNIQSIDTRISFNQGYSQSNPMSFTLPTFNIN